MTTLKEKIIEILKKDLIEYTNKKDIADKILKVVHENPSIKKGLELLQKKRADDKWKREIKG